MTNQEEVVSTPTSEEKSSDDILKEIESAQRQLKGEGANTPAVEPEGDPNVSSDQTEEVDKSDQTEDVSEPSEEAVSPDGSDKAYKDEWMKKKGLKTDKDLTEYLKNLDRNFHKKRKEEKENEARVTQFPPQQVQRPQTDNFQSPWAPTAPINEIARRYGMLPEDFERVLSLVNDASDLKAKAIIQPYAEELAMLRREVIKDKEYKTLESDPLFHKPEIKKEMIDILESDPSILAKQPDPMLYAFNQALSNVGRRYVEGSNGSGASAGDSRLGLPTTPPPSGKGSAKATKGVSIKSQAKMTGEQFAKLSLADQEKFLRSAGAYREEE